MINLILLFILLSLALGGAFLVLVAPILFLFIVSIIVSSISVVVHLVKYKINELKDRQNSINKANELIKKISPALGELVDTIFAEAADGGDSNNSYTIVNDVREIELWLITEELLNKVLKKISPNSLESLYGDLNALREIFISLKKDDSSKKLNIFLNFQLRKLEKKILRDIYNEFFCDKNSSNTYHLIIEKRLNVLNNLLLYLCRISDTKMAINSNFTVSHFRHCDFNGNIIEESFDDNRLEEKPGNIAKCCTAILEEARSFCIDCSPEQTKFFDFDALYRNDFYR